ncbi:MAG: PHP domain-containing protein [Chloroflexi bacterium]|nr:PHP domain-containing protein [Chloroflexota bacterium]
MTVDLHLHTTSSDGRLSPIQLVNLAVQRGMEIIAITDHDSTDGLDEGLRAANAYPQLTLIPGIEVSTDTADSEVHILGYFINYRDPDFQAILQRMRDSRLTRGLKMLNKLASLGIHVKWDRIRELAAGGVLGRLHIAQAMLEAGYVPTIQDAFSRYIGRRGPAYAEREKLTPVEAVGLIRKVDGIAVLAHPAEGNGADKLIPEMKAAGMVGMEVYYNGYGPETIAGLLATAREFDLIPCGGSDYHGMENDPGKELGTATVPRESALRLIALAERNLEKVVDP